jgi:hypothetical protein
LFCRRCRSVDNFCALTFTELYDSVLERSRRVEVWKTNFTSKNTTEDFLLCIGKFEFLNFVRGLTRSLFVDTYQGLCRHEFSKLCRVKFRVDTKFRFLTRVNIVPAQSTKVRVDTDAARAKSARVRSLNFIEFFSQFFRLNYFENENNSLKPLWYSRLHWNKTFKFSKSKIVHNIRSYTGPKRALLIISWKLLYLFIYCSWSLNSILNFFGVSCNASALFFDSKHFVQRVKNSTWV